MATPYGWVPPEWMLGLNPGINGGEFPVPQNFGGTTDPQEPIDPSQILPSEWINSPSPRVSDDDLLALSAPQAPGQPPAPGGSPADHAFAAVLDADRRGEQLTVSAPEDSLITTDGKVPFAPKTPGNVSGVVPPGWGVANYAPGDLAPYSATDTDTSRQGGKTTATTYGDQTSPYEKALADSRAGASEGANLARLTGNREAQLQGADAAFQREVASANTARAEDQSSKAYITQAEERLQRAKAMTDEINATKIDPTRAFSQNAGLAVANVIAGALAGWVDMKRGTNLSSQFMKVIQDKMDQDLNVQVAHIQKLTASRDAEFTAAQKGLNAAQMNEQRLDAAKTARIQQAIAAGAASKALVMKNTAPAIEAAAQLAEVEKSLWAHVKEIDKVKTEHAWQEEQKAVAHQRNLELEHLRVEGRKDLAASKPGKATRPVFFSVSSDSVTPSVYNSALGAAEMKDRENAAQSMAEVFIPRKEGGSDIHVVREALKRGGVGQAWANFLNTDEGRYVGAAAKRIIHAMAAAKLGILQPSEMELEIKNFEAGTGKLFTSEYSMDRVEEQLRTRLNDNARIGSGDPGARFDMEGYLASHTTPKPSPPTSAGSPAPESGPPPAGMSTVDDSAGMSLMSPPVPMSTDSAPADFWGRTK